MTQQFPSTIEVPTVQPTQLPNLPGNGGITVTNQDPQFSADVSAWQTFPAGQTQTLAPHQSTIFAEGSPVWARVTPGQAGSPASIELGIWPGAPSAPQGAVDIANEVTINGTVDVGTITGTVDANITNATLDISGTVAVSEVTEVTGTVTIDANNSEVTVTEVGAAVKVATLTGSTTSFTGTLPTGSNTILLGLAEQSTPTSDIGISDSAGFAIPVEWVLGGVGDTSPPTNYWLGWAAVLDPTETYTIGSINPADTMRIYASAGVRQVAVSNLPTVPPGNTGFGSVYTHDYPVTVKTVSVPNPAAGADWSYALPYAARVKFVQATLTLSAQSGDRNPALYTSQMRYTDWANGVSVTSGSANYQAFPGGPVPAVFESLYDNYIMGIPDFGVLPAGTEIGTSSGLQSEDQWSSISLVLEPV